jgi:CBS domain-containing protein
MRPPKCDVDVLVLDHLEDIFGRGTTEVRRLPVINKGKRMVGILSLGDLSRSASGDLLSEWVKSVSAHH